MSFVRYFLDKKLFAIEKANEVDKDIFYGWTLKIILVSYIIYYLVLLGEINLFRSSEPFSYF